MFVNIQHPGEPLSPNTDGSDVPNLHSDPAHPTRYSNWPDFKPGGAAALGDRGDPQGGRWDDRDVSPHRPPSPARRPESAAVTAGIGGAGGSALGLNVQPSMFLTHNLQVVGRYQVAVSDSERGLRAQRRYERPAGLNRGELYQAGYVGADYYLAAHRLKLMVGLEYARLDSRDVWTTSVAVRTFFGPHSCAPFPAAMLLEPDRADP